MTIVDFYKNLSKLLTDARENFLTKKQAEEKLENLLEEARKNKLDVDIDPKILDQVNLTRLDDENSYRPEDNDDFSNDDLFSFLLKIKLC